MWQTSDFLCKNYIKKNNLTNSMIHRNWQMNTWDKKWSQYREEHTYIQDSKDVMWSNIQKEYKQQPTYEPTHAVCFW